MKFDLDTAWNEALALLRANFRLLLIVAGVFSFLPYFAATLLVPGLAEITGGQLDPNDAATEARIQAFFMDYWWVMLLLSIVQGIGFLAMVTLLQRRANPTVGEALQFSLRAVLPYFAASLLFGLILGVAILVPVTIGIALQFTGAIVLGGILAAVLFFYLFTKFSLISPVIAIGRQLNPIKAIAQSWRLTRGNSLRLFFFYALLIIAYLVISAVIGLVFSLVFALGGAESQTFGQALSSSLMNAVFSLIFAAILAAVYAQLGRVRTPPSVPPTGHGDQAEL